MLSQGTTLIAKADFDIQPPKGRKIKVTVGDKFSVTNSQYSQEKYQLVQIDRQKKAHIGTGYYCSFNLISECFNVG